MNKLLFMMMIVSNLSAANGMLVPAHEQAHGQTTVNVPIPTADGVKTIINIGCIQNRDPIANINIGTTANALLSSANDETNTNPTLPTGINIGCIQNRDPVANINFGTTANTSSAGGNDETTTNLTLPTGINIGCIQNRDPIASVNIGTTANTPSASTNNGGIQNPVQQISGNNGGTQSSTPSASDSTPPPRTGAPEPVSVVAIYPVPRSPNSANTQTTTPPISANSASTQITTPLVNANSVSTQSTVLLSSLDSGNTPASLTVGNDGDAQSPTQVASSAMRESNSSGILLVGNREKRHDDIRFLYFNLLSRVQDSRLQQFLPLVFDTINNDSKRGLLITQHVLSENNVSDSK